MQTLFNIFGLYWICICAVSWFIQYKLYKLIKQHYYSKWVWLGKPEIPFLFSEIDHSTPISALSGMFTASYRICVYALKGDDELNKEPRLYKLWKLHRAVTIVALVSFFMFIAVAIISTVVFQVD